MYDSLIKGIKTIKIENWLQVIPQLIARIDTSRPRVGKLIHTLLCDISKYHPQVSHGVRIVSGCVSMPASSLPSKSYLCSSAIDCMIFIVVSVFWQLFCGITFLHVCLSFSV